ncbi:MAG: hypothetical protein ACXIVL_01810 [Oceanicaulis sp.]
MEGRAEEAGAFLWGIGLSQDAAAPGSARFGLEQLSFACVCSRRDLNARAFVLTRLAPSRGGVRRSVSART